MRGKAHLPQPDIEVDGITPAHAGKRWTAPWCFTAGWDHPRTCGEKNRRANTSINLPGSPPHMRGKEGQLPLLPRRRGITPAHAGKSGSTSAGPRMTRDHPPPSGEKGDEEMGGGRPPGVTPPHRGEKDPLPQYQTRFRDHPRTCGEKLFVPIVSPSPVGSPPHMRGKDSSYHR